MKGSRFYDFFPLSTTLSRLFSLFRRQIAEKKLMAKRVAGMALEIGAAAYQD
jgi:hypothetical protein